MISNMDPHVDNASRIAAATRHGMVEEIDHQGNRVRIRTGNLLTDWLPMSHGRAGGTRDWDPLTLGEQVTLQCPSGDLSQARLLPSLNSDNAPPPAGASADNTIREYPDGARWEHNHASSETRISVPAGGQIVLVAGASSITITNDCITLKTSHVVIDAADTDVQGNMVVHDLLSYLAGLAGRGSRGRHAAEITGDVLHRDGDMRSNGVVVHTHTHSGVHAGDATTGAPVGAGQDASS